MSRLVVDIIGVGVWSAGVSNASAWPEPWPEVAPDEAAPPAGTGLDRRNRRRASALTRALADVVTEAAAQGAVDLATAPTVIGSALGEAATMIRLLDQMWRTRTPLSPIAFATSVHNAAAGLISISAGNRGFTTSLAADYDTPPAALSEAIGLVASTAGPAVVACGDEAAPADLVPDGERFDMLAAAVALAPRGSSHGALATVSFPTAGDATIAPAEVPGRLARNPQIGLVDLIAAARERRWGAIRLDRGRGLGLTAVLGPPGG